MKVAVPLFGTLVSPRFDCGAELLVAEVDGGSVTTGRQTAETATNPLQRVAHLRQLGVDVVVCGGITGFVHRQLEANGIRVIPWISGEAGDALDALARGDLPQAPPWCLGKGRGRGRRGRGRGPLRLPRP